jgi:hypothetical protein
MNTNYFRQVWKMDDKLRIVAIALLAFTVLGLSVLDSVQDATEFRENSGSHTHVH